MLNFTPQLCVLYTSIVSAYAFIVGKYAYYLFQCPYHVLHIQYEYAWLAWFNYTFI